MAVGARTPGSFEIGFQIAATSLAAINKKKNYLLLPGNLGGSDGIAKTFGRFLHLSDPSMTSITYGKQYTKHPTAWLGN